MLRAAFSTACWPSLRTTLLGDEEEEERLAVTRETIAASTRGTTTELHNRDNHLNTVDNRYCPLVCVCVCVSLS